ncbi:MAG: DUF779 domain-containing protein [Proteobacteria bacterium]|nr:DUF779 domain-containing protein [Pseudomonadota bacterium]
MDVQRVSITSEAESLIDKLRSKHGNLLFHQSGGCCDGSAPMCYKIDDFKLGNADVFLGKIHDCPFFMSASQFEYWQHTHLIIDVVKGRGSGFSLEAPEGVRFLTRSRLYTDKENELLEKSPPPLRGDEASIQN